MTITVDIPEQVVDQLRDCDRPLERTALESIALEGYRCGRLGEADVRRLLGFETRIEVDAFLKAHEAYLPYSYEDFLQDREVAGRAVAFQQSR